MDQRLWVCLQSSSRPWEHHRSSAISRHLHTFHQGHGHLFVFNLLVLYIPSRCPPTAKSTRNGDENWYHRSAPWPTGALQVSSMTLHTSSRHIRMHTLSRPWK
ncbi:hypothetical protein M378DRAFT_535956 [Amanita muscaria Koide BX008]|uniref:Uncharacterized protein n=1 Tax=Amanita muscaria (strain Koide BX008) TaxID=946122 RepID=A0A0C2TEI8_AMAMK|nr:hypothetical protein M378DRAFT_535956 [Amanita muscaria Koide BX008]